MAAKPYSHASHIDKVLKASAARNSVRLVLCALCRMAKFDRPEVTASKAQLVQSTGYTRRTVQLALQWLREEGSIVPTVPLQDFVPGRGKAVTYRLHVVGQGGEDAPPDRAQDAGQGGRSLVALANTIQAENPGMTFSDCLTAAKALQ